MFRVNVHNRNRYSVFTATGLGEIIQVSSRHSALTRTVAAFFPSSVFNLPPLFHNLYLPQESLKTFCFPRTAKCDQWHIYSVRVRRNVVHAQAFFVRFWLPVRTVFWNDPAQETTVASRLSDECIFPFTPNLTAVVTAANPPQTKQRTCRWRIANLRLTKSLDGTRRGLQLTNDAYRRSDHRRAAPTINIQKTLPWRIIASISQDTNQLFRGIIGCLVQGTADLLRCSS